MNLDLKLLGGRVCVLRLTRILYAFFLIGYGPGLQILLPGTLCPRILYRTPRRCRARVMLRAYNLGAGPARAGRMGLVHMG